MIGGIIVCHGKMAEERAQKNPGATGKGTATAAGKSFEVADGAVLIAAIICLVWVLIELGYFLYEAYLRVRYRDLDALSAASTEPNAPSGTASSGHIAVRRSSFRSGWPAELGFAATTIGRTGSREYVLPSTLDRNSPASAAKITEVPRRCQGQFAPSGVNFTSMNARSASASIRLPSFLRTRYSADSSIFLPANCRLIRLANSSRLFSSSSGIAPIANSSSRL